MSAVLDLRFFVPAAAARVSLRAETPADLSAREALLDAAMGESRRRKASEAIRRGRLPAEGLSLVAADEAGPLVGTVRLWHVAAGEDENGAVPALLLGPLAVSPLLAGRGVGSSLVRRAVAEAAWRGYERILLVGDEPYYGRFGFRSGIADGLFMPGPFERHRLLALESGDRRLASACGLIRPTGALDASAEAAA